MELKPVKRNINVSYPTVSEASKISSMSKVLMITNAPAIIYIATPSYIPVRPSPIIVICQITRLVFALTALLATILLFIKNNKINNSKNETTEKNEKLKSSIKSIWWAFGLSVILVIIISAILIYLENYMYL